MKTRQKLNPGAPHQFAVADGLLSLDRHSGNELVMTQELIANMPGSRLDRSTLDVE
jgi:hypothetical protein